MKQKIVHVTEALGGGVLHCLVLLANRQAMAGDDVVILHSIRPDTPDSEKLDAIFDSRVRREVIDMRTSIGPRDLVSMVRIGAWLTREKPDIVHLHSSKAAAIGRVVTRVLGMSRKAIYSPHGFAFLKEDISPLKAKLFLLIERWLHALGGHLLACSKSELRYARMLLKGGERSSVIENAVELSAFRKGDMEAGRHDVTVCTAGRVTYQKAPWRMSLLAQRLANKSNVRFMWFGDGDAEVVERWIDRSRIDISGWMQAPALRRRLAQCDVFVLPSLWEGMPIALIEAQAAGLPAVASRVVGNRDVIVHGVTGFLANSDDEMEQYTLRLINDESLRRRMGTAARKHAFAKFGGQRLFRSHVDLYRHLLGPSRARLT